MRRDACAGTACLPKLKRCETPEKEKKREASIDLNRWTASGPGNFRQSRDDRACDAVKTLCAGAVFAERRHRLAGVSTDADARIDFHFAKHRNTISDRRFRAFAVA